jgi:hypothetical protein
LRAKEPAHRTQERQHRPSPKAQGLSAPAVGDPSGSLWKQARALDWTQSQRLIHGGRYGTIASISIDRSETLASDDEQASRVTPGRVSELL